MVVIILECAPQRISGYCSSWALQVATGVYVGRLPAKEREQIWDTIVRWANADTRAVMIWPSSRFEQGIDFRTLGSPRRRITEIEGLLVSTWLPDENGGSQEVST